MWGTSMKKWLICIFLMVLLSMAGCFADSGGTSEDAASDKDSTSQVSEGSGAETDTQEGGKESMEQFEMENGKTVYLYVPQAVKNQPEIKVPLILFMCGTTCDPVENCVDSGWTALAEKENFIVVSPDYNNYATYSETDFLISVVEYMIENFPVDTERIYSTGFSNGGAASVALTNDYPEYFAAISAMGWMVNLDSHNSAYDMPFQVVQGDGEFTERTPSGAMTVMDDEKESVRSLFLYNEMINEELEPDYDAAPYWGYMPDESETVTMDGREWKFDNYYKDGYSVPFAQLVIVEDSEHRPRKEEAEVAWNFFRNFKRNADGEIELCSTESTEIEREYTDLVYDTLSPSQKLDLYLPETGSGPFPLLVFIHGGGWYGGDKADGQEDAFVALREQGYAVASLNYRLSGEASHPAGIIDCKTAIRFLKANADRYHIDPERFAVSGDSSGGHYALMVALTSGNPELTELQARDTSKERSVCESALFEEAEARGYAEENTDVCCAVVWYPATDLAETMRTVQDGEYTGFGASFAWSNIERYVGKTIQDVKDDCLVQASPINYISADMPPILLQHGNADTICPMDQSQRFYRAAVDAVGEERVSLTILDGAQHGDSAFETAENMETVKAFLDRYLTE